MQNPNPKKRSSNHSRFLSSMTFASVPTTRCECDECGIITESSVIPPSVTEAVKRHKRNRMMEEDYPPAFQERSLVARDVMGGVSVWKLVLPPGSEPLVEFGNSHRIVLVDSMPVGRTIRSIGNGIIGSASEKQSRRTVTPTWRTNDAHLYRSNGGKAIGWVNEKQESDRELRNIDDTDGDVVLYVVKATRRALSGGGEDGEGGDGAVWASAVKDLFHRYVDEDVSRVDDAGEEKIKDVDKTGAKDVDGPGVNDLEKTLAESDAQALHTLVVSMIDN